MAHDVFICYSSNDKTVADSACAALEGRGARCWMAPRDVRPGKDWGEAIEDAISSSRVMVFVFSGSANASPQVKREVERAVGKGIAVVPFRIESVALSTSLECFLSKPQWMDAFAGPIEPHFARLADVVLALVGPEQVEPAAAPARPDLKAIERQLAAKSRGPIVARPGARVLPRGGVFAALIIGVTGALLARGLTSSTPSAARAGSTGAGDVGASVTEKVIEPTTAPATAPASDGHR